MITALLLAGPAQADTAPPPDERLSILTEDYPPLNYREDRQITGQATAVVRAMADAVGESPTYELTSWDDGYRAATRGPDTALYSTMMTEQRRGQLQWIGPIGALDTNLYALSDAALPVNNLADARRAEGIDTVTDYYITARNFSRKRASTISSATTMNARPCRACSTARQRSWSPATSSCRAC